MTTFQSMKTRIDTIEQTPAGPSSTDPINDQRKSGPRHVDETDISAMASGVPYQDGEDILQKARDIIGMLGDKVSSHVAVISATRLRARFDNRPPLVKITFHCIGEKITVLRNKMELKKSKNYNDVYLKSCKSHAERLIEINARTLIRQLPEGLNLRVDANGRIIQRAQQENQETEKKKAQQKARQERQKVKRAEDEVRGKEEREKKRFLSLSDSEKRALAAEKTFLAQTSRDGLEIPVLSRCFFCGEDMTGNVPFEYMVYTFCTSRCLQQHRKQHATR